MTPLPTALTPGEQKVMERVAREGADAEDCGILVAIIRRLDAEIARLDALVRHAEADCVILRDRAVEASKEAREACRAEQRERDAKIIPTNWCDPLLSGPTTTLKGNGPWYCMDIERLLSAIAAAIRSQR